MIKKLIVLSLIVLGIIFLKFSSAVRADWELNYQGNLIYSSPQVLGEDIEVREDDRDEKIEQDDEENETEDDTDEPEEEPENEEVEQEIENENVETLDINRDNNKLKVGIKTKDNRLIESDQDEFEIDDENGDELVKISSGEAENEIQIEKNQIKVRTNFPLTINPLTKELIVNKPAGQKIVAILPDRAATIISSLGILDNPQIETEIEIQTEGDQLVYKIKGKKREKFLGFFNIDLNKEVAVSAETGSLLKINESLLTRVIDFLSF